MDTNTIAVQKFPIFPENSKIYVITQADANLNIEQIVIPDGHSLVVDPQVQAIEWVVGRLTFGKDTTIDLSAAAPKPAKAPDGAPPPPQAPHGKAGRWGNGGGAGAAGRDGISLTLRGLTKIDNRGSLWIKTDGGPGGDGGHGGQGQQGGGPRNEDFPWGHKAQPGGQGGAGGPGGRGGATSNVRVVFGNSSLRDRFTTGFAEACGSSSRPPGASGNTGVVAFYGAPGCGGAGGSAGAGGLGGDVSVRNGAPGPAGSQGLEGERIPVSS